MQADETDWREDDQNGYIWSLSPPTIRDDEDHHSRAGEVVKHLIGQDFQGVLGSDFYVGSNIHQGRRHQRCWIHFLRDVHELKKQFPEDQMLLNWARQVKAISEEAVSWAVQDPEPSLSPRQQHQARVAQRHAFERQLWTLCQPYVQRDVPQRTLCKRVENFLPELFVFVEIPGVPAHNHLAERSVRPFPGHCSQDQWRIT